MADKDDLLEFFDHVRSIVPTATSVDVETSDQDQGYGFNLCDVTLADGTKLSDVDASTLSTLVDDAWAFLCDIDWDGVVGEDERGYATLDLPSKE